MSDRPDRLYSEWKQELSKAFYKVANHPEYINRTYSGRDFYEALYMWEDTWFGLAYNSTDIDVDHYWEDTTCFKNKLTKWTYWDHEFNRVLWEMIRTDNPLPFRCPDFLDGMFDITHKFLMAKTQEEESKVLNETYRINLVKEVKHYEKDSPYYTSDRTWKTEKYIWLSEDNLGIKSSELPRYAPYDLTHVMRGKKLYDWYRKNFKDGPFVHVSDYIKDAKEIWKCYRLAIKKGLLIDNHDKEKKKK